jgi:hypothetical protein
MTGGATPRTYSWLVDATNLRLFSGVGDTTLLTIASTGAATFGSIIYLPNSIAGRTSQIEFGNLSSGDLLGMPNQTSTFYLSYGTNNINFRNDNFGEILRLSNNGAATFFSSVTAGGDVNLESNESYINLFSSYAVGLNARARIRAVGAGGGSGYGGDFRVSTRATNNTWNTDAFVVDSNGNVGIGTASPSGRLDVANTNDLYTNLVTSGNNTSSVLSLFNSTGVTDGAAICYNVAMRFGTVTGLNAAGFSERMRITSGGNVLIGTTSGNGARLQVHDGFATFASFIRVSGSASDIYPGAGQIILEGLTNSASALTTSAGGDVGLRFDHRGVSNNGYWVWANGTNAGNERMRITSIGDISLNGGSSSGQNQTATPKNIRFNNDYSNGYTDASLKLYLFNSGSTRQGFGSGSEFDLQYHSSGSTSGKHVFYVANNHVMTVNNLNVLIGTQTDSSDKLRVNGNTFTNTITTYRPGVNTTKSDAWKLGRAALGTQPTETHQITVEIGGVSYVIGAAQL